MKKVSREEMKKVMGGDGGKGKLVCTCTGTMDTVVCSFNSLAGSVNCAAGAIKYCGGNATCSGSYR